MKMHRVKTRHIDAKAARLDADGRDGDAYRREVMICEIPGTREDEGFAITVENREAIAARWPEERMRRKTSSRIGDHYEAIIKRDTGATKQEGCGCDGLRNRMNAWGPEGCREHRDEIISETIANAKGHSMKYMLGLMIPGASTLARPVVGAWLDEAIRESESE